MYDAEVFRSLIEFIYLNDWTASLFVLAVALAAGKSNGTTVPLREYIEMQMLNFERLLREGFAKQEKQFDDLEENQEKKTDALTTTQKEHGKRIGQLEFDMRNISKLGAIMLSILTAVITALIITVVVSLAKGWWKLP